MDKENKNKLWNIFKKFCFYFSFSFFPPQGLNGISKLKESQSLKHADVMFVMCLFLFMTL